MNSWERFDETSLPNKEAFYSSLNMEDITDVDYRHAKRVFKNFSNKNLGDYHDLYVQSDTFPAGKYWSPGRPLKILFDHPIFGTSQSDVLGTF